MPAVSTGHRNPFMIFAGREGMGWWRMTRTALSPAEVDEVWRRWRSGQAVKVLARAMRRNSSTVRDLLKRSGGIRPVPRRGWERRLSLAEREEISRAWPPATRCGRSLPG